MKLIIDIPDKIYEEMLKNKGTDKSLDFDEGLILEVAAENGTLLPKGHGDLIDADKMIKELNEGIQRLDESKNEILKQLGEPEENNQIPLWMWKGCCKTCGVIIEADKGE